MRHWVALDRVKIFGASIRLHISVALIIGTIALTALGSVAFGLVTVASLLAVILLHECGHVFVARRLGCHAEHVWLTAFHGYCEFHTPMTEWQRAIIAWGGVCFQLTIAIPVVTLDSLHPHPWGLLGPIVLVLGYYN